jgi:YesN/AraC family two-component response regulator
MGFRVFHALDALQALDIVAQEPIIDLLVTDIIMPGGMNGIELAKKVRQLKPNVKIIYLSGFPSKGLAERSGMHINGPLLSKPYQRQDFMMLIRNEMGGNKISQLDTEGKVDS